MRVLTWIILAAILSAVVFAENMTTANSTRVNITTSNVTNFLNSTIPQTNITVPHIETVKPPVVNFTVTSLFPKEFKVGDIQFNIQVQNTGDVELKNVVAIVAGPGFSSYDTVPIDSLKPGEKSYVIVMGNVKFDGVSTLMIRINERLFYQNISVIDPEARQGAAKLEEMQKQEDQLKLQLSDLRAQLDALKSNYSALEFELEKRKGQQYDVGDVKLDDLKTFLRNAESSIIVGDAKAANVSVTLASDEFKQQFAHLMATKKIETSFMQVVKDNLVLISTMAGALITIFSFYEVLKKKKDSLKESLKSSKPDKVAPEKKKKASA